MVVFDQLRISDDGQAMFINAHVNKSSYFDDIHISKVTICTEDQVLETDPMSYGEDFVYQKEVTPVEKIVRLYERTQILSEKQLLNHQNQYGGWQVSFTPLEAAEDHAISMVMSGKYSVLDSEFAPQLVIASPSFNPTVDRLNHPEVLAVIEGTPFEDKGHKVWQFRGKESVGDNFTLCFYLFKQTTEGIYEYVRLDATDDYEFLHFLWQIYEVKDTTTKKEVHLVLTKNDFNEKFNKSDLSHNLFFVYIECEGTPDSCTPCRLDEMTTLGVTFDYALLYNQAMGYTGELADDCQIPHGFIDFILNIEALKLAIETEHYVPAIGYWKWLMGNSHNMTAYGTKPCGCHG